MTTELSMNQVQEWALAAVKRFQDVESFDDVERLFLRGQGLSKNSYTSYLQAVKGMWHWTEGKHPLQWTPADVEAYYDSIVERHTLDTAALRMAGLRNFCKCIQSQLPFWQSPFDVMSEKLSEKLRTTSKGSQKPALYREELQAVLEHVRKTRTLYDLQNRAIILTLVTTGLRAAELCNLRRSDLEHDSDRDMWLLSGIGKGRKPFTVQVHQDAVDAILFAFRKQHKRAPRPDDPLFWTIPNYTGKEPTPLSKPVLWARLKKIGNELQNAGLVRQRIQFSAHLFRRTFLTLLSREGMSVRALQHCSRHSNVKTLMEHYVDDHQDTTPYLDRIMGKAV